MAVHPQRTSRWVGVVVAAVGLAALSFAPSVAQESEGTDARWDSEGCLSCHDGETATIAFPSGEEVPIGVDGDAYASATHAATGVQCVHCHSNIARYPHPVMDSPDARSFAVEVGASCSRCHWREFTVRLDAAHALVDLDVRADVPLCIDCHDAHAVQALALDDTVMQARCSDCHDDEVQEELAAIHTLDPTRAEEATAPPLILFYALVFGAITLLIALSWGVVLGVQWLRRRMRTVRVGA